MLDLTKTRDAHIDERLRSNIMIWLTTVRADGRPHSAAVWFLWDGKAFLIFSRPNKQKIRNLRQNSNVLLALDDTKNGSDVIQVEGKAELLEHNDVDATLSAFAEKYGPLIKQLGGSPEAMAADYSQGIRITPTKFLGPVE
ncbi:MAG TPA: TIGR03667 family PPOX class F420-dependent oxidoreductase [Ktedonobacteraceae bacterium]